MKYSLALLLLVMLTHSLQAQKKWSEISKGTYNIVKNPSGQTLGYSASSGVKILTVNSLAFKDLNKNGKLDKFEDWRLPYQVRAKYPKV